MFDQVPRHETAASDLCVAVAVAGLRPLLADVEGRLRSQQPPGALLARAVTRERLRLVLLRELSLHEAQQVVAALLGLRRGVRRGVIRQSAGAVEVEGLVVRAEVAGAGV